MKTEDQIELGMLSAALQMAVCYRESEPQDLMDIAKVINDWSHADDTNRREIYREWRNSGR